MLDNFLRELDADIKKQALRHKPMWPFKEHTIEELLEELERHKAHLMLAFSINTRFVTGLRLVDLVDFP